ncbi:hypothetical protein [Faecalibacter rhinopitheci]|uniref:Uncharacterized protein n=1 Tax=Faecalibacter rhinopitheci TaxID=2779678 RepID=A0A8J7FWQ8_9FLAO|nr:hypothetical protein [Faecalibacter rhinopitheci]MBF0598061.1 hypothetical protein [Faecalibacter rhinopitheci]MBQ0148279.1 hypothetical protein [Candidatus Onthonaster equi]
MYKIEIYGENKDELTIDLEQAVQPIQNIEGYFWKILWIDGESETEEYSVFELQEVIDQQDGIVVDFEALVNLSHKMATVSEALIIGDRNEKNLFVNIEDENLYDNEIVLELVKDSHWQVVAKEEIIIDTFKVEFPNSEIIE